MLDEMRTGAVFCLVIVYVITPRSPNTTQVSMK